MSKKERREFLKAALAAMTAIPVVGCRCGAMCYAPPPPPGLPSHEKSHLDKQEGIPDEKPQNESD